QGGGQRPPGLDRKSENREKGETRSVERLRDRMVPGDVAVVPVRSGGPFDPMGCRGVDVARADDVVALVDHLDGRWLLVTLTVDRSMWTCPEAAYQRCNERVREVARAIRPGAVYFVAFEVQTKTGEGWPHWHMCFHLGEDPRSPAELKRTVERAWSIITDSVDVETGEVFRSRERIGFVDVQEAKNRQGTGRYVAKYCTKQWDVVPPWMGNSRRQLRKLRLSSPAFDVLVGLERHVRHRGGRVEPGKRRRARARRLFDRMAESCSKCVVVRCERSDDGRQLRAVRTIKAYAWQVWEAAHTEGVRYRLAKRGGRVGHVPIMSAGAFGALWERLGGRIEAERDGEVEFRRLSIENAWDYRQEEADRREAAADGGRTLDGGQSPGGSAGSGRVRLPVA
ncbi:MAG: hypothetical protein HND27_11130, partial [Bacteroidetes bacterium]|nr:hypothetical protein [Bacteroidota bacterium]